MRFVRIGHSQSTPLFKKHAFEGNNVLSLANKITHNEVPSIPNHYSAQLFQLIKMLLQKDPTDRPTTR